MPQTFGSTVNGVLFRSLDVHLDQVHTVQLGVNNNAAFADLRSMKLAGSVRTEIACPISPRLGPRVLFPLDAWMPALKPASCQANMTGKLLVLAPRKHGIQTLVSDQQSQKINGLSKDRVT